ncbi:MAG: hypothetical protein E4H40_00790 [Candidatus Brocadiia bacterium]|nr:MAG: hypothetical protein E4H40_00790 [Candidatus Brocadiia bacterium]
MDKAIKTAGDIKRPPGACISWQEKLKELPELKGDPAIVQQVWESTDALAYIYIWQLVLSF